MSCAPLVGGGVGLGGLRGRACGPRTLHACVAARKHRCAAPCHHHHHHHMHTHLPPPPPPPQAPPTPRALPPRWPTACTAVWGVRAERSCCTRCWEGSTRFVGRRWRGRWLQNWRCERASETAGGVRAFKGGRAYRKGGEEPNAAIPRCGDQGQGGQWGGGGGGRAGTHARTHARTHTSLHTHRPPPFNDPSLLPCGCVGIRCDTALFDGRALGFVGGWVGGHFGGGWVGTSLPSWRGAAPRAALNMPSPLPAAAAAGGGLVVVLAGWLSQPHHQVTRAVCTQRRPPPLAANLAAILPPPP